LELGTELVAQPVATITREPGAARLLAVVVDFLEPGRDLLVQQQRPGQLDRLELPQRELGPDTARRDAVVDAARKQARQHDQQRDHARAVGRQDEGVCDRAPRHTPRLLCGSAYPNAADLPLYCLNGKSDSCRKAGTTLAKPGRRSYLSTKHEVFGRI